jgi:tyrosyl-tRNA synthetase
VFDWQFWRNTDDRDVIKFLKMFTDLELNKIEKLKNEDINKLKILLANEAASMLHGKSAATKAEKTAKATFESGGSAFVAADLPCSIEAASFAKRIFNLLISSFFNFSILFNSKSVNILRNFITSLSSVFLQNCQ